MNETLYERRKREAHERYPAALTLRDRAERAVAQAARELIDASHAEEVAKNVLAVSMRPPERSYA
jgi:hypothetical protein